MKSDSDRWRNDKNAELSEVIQQLFEMGPSSVASEGRFLFHITLHTLTLLPILAKQQWIYAILAAQVFYEKRSAAEIVVMQRFMERWRSRRR